MRTTIDLQPEVLDLIQSVAVQRHQTVGEVVSEAALAHYGSAALPSATLTRDEQGFPQIDIGRPITTEGVKAMIAEDEAREITRGDPQHPFHKPIITTDERGFPQVEIGRPLTLEEVRAAVEEE